MNSRSNWVAKQIKLIPMGAVDEDANEGDAGDVVSAA
jgi:hypothetical protein